MTTQHRSPGSPRHPVTVNHRVEQLLAGLFVVAMGIVTFRVVLSAADDTMLALLGPVLVFLLGASLFSGDRRGRL